MSAPALRQPTDPTPRIGVLVVAYNASSTLVSTLERLPEAFRRRVDHVLVSDDCSQDDTYEVGVRFANGNTLPMTVIRHEQNLGYGGNQKAGYEWAISHGLDIVVLLHGDGQYAPECIEDLVTPLVSGEADAVFGSRMMVKGGARAGGMPAYKFVGNRILTAFQNKMVGLDLSEWHSGYRAYRVDALAALDLDSYTDDFDFDTEIILGLHTQHRRIVEVPIPTYYGDEICYVNGLAYARNVAKDVVRYRASQMGFGEGHEASSTAYDLKPSPHSSHGVLLDWLDSRDTGKVLDVGCSDGGFGSLARELGHHVTGVDLLEHPGVTQRLDAFHVADLNAGLPDDLPSQFDTVVAGDVLEHVIDPLGLLQQLGDRLTPRGEVLVSIPNFGHWYPRARVAAGRFDYDQRGPLDHGHVRFFTRRSFEKLVDRAGMRIVERVTVGSPVDVLERADVSDGLLRVARGVAVADRAATRAWPTLFGYQLLYRLERA
jgi:SAM-dependent methyltransferase